MIRKYVLAGILTLVLAGAWAAGKSDVQLLEDLKDSLANGYLDTRVHPVQYTILATGRTLDFALPELGFFRIKDSRGREYLTRCGNFVFDEQGVLGLFPALTLVPTLRIKGSFGFVSLDRNILTYTDDGEVKTYTFQIVDFEKPRDLKGTRFAVRDDEVTSIDAQVIHGFLQTSSINPLATLLELYSSYVRQPERAGQTELIRAILHKYMDSKSSLPLLVKLLGLNIEFLK